MIRLELQEFFREHPRVALAFSGGCDSAYLLWEARKNGADVQAYYVKTPFQPQFEFDDAKRLASELQIPLHVIESDGLQDPLIAANSKNRCYLCKRRIMKSIIQAAAKDGISVVMDGTNASDQTTDRPGMKALQEFSIVSPLRMAGLSKEEVRRRSKEAGLFTWNKPAYACLATRIPTGEALTHAKLERTEWAEDFLFSLGFTDFRVRSKGDQAIIQLRESQMPLLLEERKRITEQLSKCYSSVVLDLVSRDE